MKKLISLLVVAFALSLAACSSQGGQEQASQETQAVNPKPNKTFEETKKAFLEHAVDILQGKKYIPPSSGEAKAHKSGENK